MKPTIISVQIGPMPRPMPEGAADSMPQVAVTYGDGTSETLFSFYPDELQFQESNFIGLTRDQAMDLRRRKDVEYLKSEPSETRPQTKTRSLFDTPEWDELRDAFQKSEDDRIQRMQNHPDNGKTGYWKVAGTRHDAYAYASSALEAIEKAQKAKLVGDWEFPEAEFFCEELPEVF